MLADYCNLCTMLPNISVELGLKAAELIKFLNSRICQLVLGAGAISVAGLKTITIRNIALAIRSLQLVVHVIPYVLMHFQKCHSERNQNLASPQMNGTKSDLRQLEVLQRQFEQAVKHLKNHSEELKQKILAVVNGIVLQHLNGWNPPKSGEKLPSASFKVGCVW
jgi:vacuolar protein sorting-associated protein 54